MIQAQPGAFKDSYIIYVIPEVYLQVGAGRKFRANTIHLFLKVSGRNPVVSCNQSRPNGAYRAEDSPDHPNSLGFPPPAANYLWISAAVKVMESTGFAPTDVLLDTEKQRYNLRQPVGSAGSWQRLDIYKHTHTA